MQHFGEVEHEITDALDLLEWSWNEREAGRVMPCRTLTDPDEIAAAVATLEANIRYKFDARF